MVFFVAFRACLLPNFCFREFNRGFYLYNHWRLNVSISFKNVTNFISKIIAAPNLESNLRKLNNTPIVFFSLNLVENWSFFNQASKLYWRAMSLWKKTTLSFCHYLFYWLQVDHPFDLRINNKVENLKPLLCFNCCVDFFGLKISLFSRADLFN